MTLDYEEIELGGEQDLIGLFRSKPDDPVTGLLVLHGLMASGSEIPQDLRNWFAERLALTLDSHGEVSMDFNG